MECVVTNFFKNGKRHFGDYVDYYCRPYWGGSQRNCLVVFRKTWTKGVVYYPAGYQQYRCFADNLFVGKSGKEIWGVASLSVFPLRALNSLMSLKKNPNNKDLTSICLNYPQKPVPLFSEKKPKIGLRRFSNSNSYENNKSFGK